MHRRNSGQLGTLPRVDESTTTPVATRPRTPPARLPVLVGRSDQVTGVVAALSGVVILGRDLNLDLSLPHEGVSRRHAEVAVASDGTVRVRDLGSTNGTLVDGLPIQTRELTGGELIAVGPVELEFRFVTAAELEHVRQKAEAQARLSTLSPREREVADLVARGLRSNEIATQLCISVRTVNTHLEHIYERLQVRGRLLLTRLVVEAGS